ncbi:lantibiotic dehydratase [Streptomyces diastatochromogenes]|nr:lantibiotic dehydratase [Streptomyces diastatochromogenes]
MPRDGADRSRGARHPALRRRRPPPGRATRFPRTPFPEGATRCRTSTHLSCCRAEAGGWEQSELRGPGFPADGVLRLAPPGLAEAADKFGPDADLSGTEWQAFTEDVSEAAVRTARRLQEIAAQARFQAALAWQNPAVLRTGIAPFLRWTPTADSRSSMPRQREELVAHYWQRFCVKNDTIGFFGPVGWGRWDPSTPDAVAVDPGQGFLAASEVYFSGWAIDALAKVLAEDRDLMRWIPPRRVSFVRPVDGAVRVPGRPAQRIGATELAVLRLCDGTCHPDAIADALGIEAGEAARIVGELVSRRWVHWKLEVPAATRPDRALRRILERVPDEAARERALAKLAVLERGRDAVRSAGTDATALTRAIGDLEADFAALTDSEAQRAKGERTAPCRGWCTPTPAARRPPRPAPDSSPTWSRSNSA